MKIYTYYEDLGHDIGFGHDNFLYQEELIEMWKYSWVRAGFEPVVLGPDDAKNNPYYDTLMPSIQDMTMKLSKCDKKNRYELACFKRWFAYASQTGYFLSADYDVINYNFNPFKETDESGKWTIEDEHGSSVDKDKLTFFACFCPCLQSGYQEHYVNILHAFESITRERFETLVTIFNDPSLKSKTGLHPSGNYHDQDFFVINFGTDFMNPDQMKYNKDYKISHRFYDGFEHYSKAYIWSELTPQDEHPIPYWQDTRISTIKKKLNETDKNFT